jgi:uncharacterized membrane protein YphA (DoxX/SURF4 family)
VRAYTLNDDDPTGAVTGIDSMDTVFTLIQILLGIVFFGAGISHLRGLGGATVAPQMAWLHDVPPTPMRILAVLEMLGGLVLVGSLIAGANWLGAMTAACFVVLMVFAIVFHARRPGEVPTSRSMPSSARPRSSCCTPMSRSTNHALRALERIYRIVGTMSDTRYVSYPMTIGGWASSQSTL